VLDGVTGGAAFGNIKTSIAGVGDASDSKVGWTVGGGLEAAIAGPWTAKIEYLYVDLGNGGSQSPRSYGWRATITVSG
jgi:outer membrane immunogenic protein